MKIPGDSSLSCEQCSLLTTSNQTVDRCHLIHSFQMKMTNRSSIRLFFGNQIERGVVKAKVDSSQRHSSGFNRRQVAEVFIIQEPLQNLNQRVSKKGMNCSSLSWISLVMHQPIILEMAEFVSDIYSSFASLSFQGLAQEL